MTSRPETVTAGGSKSLVQFRAPQSIAALNRFRPQRPRPNFYKFIHRYVKFKEIEVMARIGTKWDGCAAYFCHVSCDNTLDLQRAWKRRLGHLDCPDHANNICYIPENVNNDTYILLQCPVVRIVSEDGMPENVNYALVCSNYLIYSNGWK